MTVHQAKGLEFPVVFVPICGALERSDVPPVSFDRTLGLSVRVFDERDPARRVHSTASRRAFELREARLRAESLRLFYVAATRARDRVIFSGEPVSPSADTWRTHLDALLADPATSTLLTLVDGDALTLPPSPRTRPQQLKLFGAPEPATPTVTLGEDDLPALGDGTVRARSIGAAVTQLADFALCPRRYQQFHELDLQEHPAVARAASPDLQPADAAALPLDPLRRGTLAHRLLEQCDFGLGGADVERLVEADGYDVLDPAVQEVCRHVRGFLQTDFARALAGRPLRRELPFVLAVPLPRGAQLFVRGQIDLLILEERGVTVIDYKHARRGEPGDYRFQLSAYAAAVRRLYPQAPSVRIGLSFLKEADPTPSLTEAALTERFDHELAVIGDALIEARARDRWDGRPLDFCRSVHCGYVYRCHPPPA
jgi:ATP-dependent helicase/nuclease subunit A